MIAWSELPRKEEDLIWDRFIARFKFRPSVLAEDWPGIVEPSPSVTYSLAGAFEAARDRGDLLSRATELNRAMLDAFRQCTAEDEALYVLDWQHPCFLLRPHADFPAADWSRWKTPVFPDGDYYIFLQQELEFGTFGHPWEKTLCVFGTQLIQAFDAASVEWLGPLIRKDGAAA